MLMMHLNMGVDPSHEFTERDDDFLKAAFNKLPKHITAENIASRKNRAFLLQCTEDLNTNNARMFDILDIFLRLNQLRKSGALNDR